jgi:hypothetical protein
VAHRVVTLPRITNYGEETFKVTDGVGLNLNRDVYNKVIKLYNISFRVILFRMMDVIHH